jgi:hypothetical protein
VDVALPEVGGIAKGGNNKAREGTNLNYRDIRVIIRILSLIGLLIGVIILFLGLSGSSSCPEQTVGRPSTCPSPFAMEADVGLAIIIISAIG